MSVDVFGLGCRGARPPRAAALPLRAGFNPLYIPKNYKPAAACGVKSPQKNSIISSLTQELPNFETEPIRAKQPGGAAVTLKRTNSTHARTRARMQAHTHTHAHKHICTHAHMHTHMHVHANAHARARTPSARAELTAAGTPSSAGGDSGGDDNDDGATAERERGPQ